MDMLLVLGSWCAGSVVVSLVLGAVVARAERPDGVALDAGVPAVPATPTAPLPLVEVG